LYLDENLDSCKPILAVLAANSVAFERHQNHYARGTDDDIWLPFVGKNRWIVLTKDKKNRYNEWERSAVRRFRVREFCFGSGNMSGLEMAEALAVALPKLRKICQREEPPLVVSITKSGDITILFDRHGSTHERRKAGRG